MSALFDIKGRVVLVTGSNLGNGLGMAQGIKDAGAVVLRLDRTFDADIGAQDWAFDLSNLAGIPALSASIMYSSLPRHIADIRRIGFAVFVEFRHDGGTAIAVFFQHHFDQAAFRAGFCHRLLELGNRFAFFVGQADGRCQQIETWRDGEA